MTSIGSQASGMNNARATEQQLWDHLKQRNLLKGELPERLINFTPWYIRAAQSLAGWVSGLFLLGFVITLLATIFEFENAFVMMLFALAGNGLAYFMAQNQKKTEFVQQQSLAFNLCGQSLFAWGLFILFDSWELGLFLSLLVYQCLIIYYIADYSSRVITTWFAMFALYASLSRLELPNLNLAVAASIFVYVWLRDIQWKQQNILWEPVGFGVAFSLYPISGYGISNEITELWGQSLISPWLDSASFWLSEFILSSLLIYIVFIVAKKFRVALNSNSGTIVIAGCLLMLLVRFYVPGTDAAMLLILVGFMKQRQGLLALGLFSFIAFLSWYYYQLDLTLLAKSINLIVSGSGFLLAYFLLSLKMKDQKMKIPMASDELIHGDSEKSVTDIPKISLAKKWIVIGASFLILVLVNINIYQKENILTNGQLVLLKLAPVDPRSLMQGDYMRLRFDIERTLLEDTRQKEVSNQANVERAQARSKSSIFVVALDKNHVGSYLRKTEGLPLKPSEVKMQFRVRDGRIRLATHAFFFQEGTAQEYEKAVYGEFRVAENGELLLNNLRDNKFVVLGYNRPSN